MKRSVSSLVDEGVILDEEIKDRTRRLDEIKATLRELAEDNAGSLEGKLGTALVSVSKAAMRLDSDAIKAHFGEKYLRENGFLKEGKPVLSVRFARKVQTVVADLPKYISQLRKKA